MPNYDPETMTEDELMQALQEIMGLGAIPDEQGLLTNLIGQGMQRQNAPLARGQEVGRTYVASSPLEHLSVALERGMGGRQQASAQDAYRKTLAQQTQGRTASAMMSPEIRALFEEIKRRQAQQPPTGFGGGGFGPPAPTNMGPWY